MPPPPSPGSSDGALLSAALRGVRKRRGLTKADAAAAMGMALRTYERFESGDTRFNLHYLHRFAEATHSDPYALILAVSIGSPEFAQRCADNKFGTILTVATQRLNLALGDRLEALDTRTLISAVTEAMDRLAGDATEDPASAWLREGVQEIATRRPKPGR